MNHSIAISICASVLLSTAFVSEAKATLNNSTFSSSVSTSNTLSLDNLERERAALVEDILNNKIDSETRAKQLAKRQRSLSDMERMVMRDERLLQSQSSRVSKAFAEYESTFLVHAGAEHKRSAAEQWLASVKLSNQAIMTTSVGYRK